jgi:hypothetical protein
VSPFARYFAIKSDGPENPCHVRGSGFLAPKYFPGGKS